MAENLAASSDLDIFMPVFVLGGVADEFILADGLLQLYVDVIFPIIFLDAVCQSVAVGRGGQFDFKFLADDFIGTRGGLVERGGRIGNGLFDDFFGHYVQNTRDFSHLDDCGACFVDNRLRFYDFCPRKFRKIGIRAPEFPLLGRNFL